MALLNEVLRVRTHTYLGVLERKGFQTNSWSKYKTPGEVNITFKSICHFVPQGKSLCFPGFVIQSIK